MQIFSLYIRIHHNDYGFIIGIVPYEYWHFSFSSQFATTFSPVSGASSVTGSMATKLKQYSDEGNLTELAVQLILNEKKTETGKVTLTEKKIRKYFPKEYNREQIEQVIYELLDNWKKSQ